MEGDHHAVTNLAVGDRVVIPFQISCGSCYMCDQQLYTQCETTQVRDQGMGAALFGYSELYGQVPGVRLSCCASRRPSSPTSKCLRGRRIRVMSICPTCLPTAWQAVAYAAIPDGGIRRSSRLGPIGDMTARIAAHLGYEVIAVDRVAERLARAEARGIRTIDLRERDDLGDLIRDLTDGRGTDSVIDAVGMEAHGSPVAKLAQQLTGLLPDAVAQSRSCRRPVWTGSMRFIRHRHRATRRHDLADRRLRRHGRPAAHADFVRQADQLRMGQANVKKWVDDIMPLLTDDDPLGVDSFASHAMPLDEAAHGYHIFQKKKDGAVKITLKP